MSELDKEAVLDEFTEAYKKAHGKKPKIEASNGWYSVDGGKNMRLAQLDEWAKELKSGGSKKAKKETSSKKSTTKSSTAKKTAAKKPASKTKKSASSGKKPSQRKSDQSAAQTPAQAWLTHLQKQTGSSRLPRGFKA